MRERQTIEREIYRAREDLEENLAELDPLTLLDTHGGLHSHVVVAENGD